MKRVSSSPAAFAGNQSTETAAGAHALADAFASFVATSTRLEGAYRELQGEVSGLREELAERNSALKASLAENERVRKALQEIVDSMPCGVLVVSAAGRLTTINPEASRLLELGPEPALLSEIETRLGLETRLTRLAARGGDAEEEFPWQSAAAERWLHIIVRQIVSSKNDTAHSFTIFMVRDITAQKREENYREAARNATVLAEITTMLAHEIRNPLASLELFANLIEQDDARAVTNGSQISVPASALSPARSTMCLACTTPAESNSSRSTSQQWWKARSASPSHWQTRQASPSSGPVLPTAFAFLGARVPCSKCC